MRHPRQDFRIHQVRRIYDKSTDQFTFNVSYETRTQVTPRSIVVAEAFGLGINETEIFPVLDAQLQIHPKDIVYITGDSGSGKSVLLRALRQDLGFDAIDINEVEVDPDKPLIETVGKTVEEALELLSKVGLNDAFLFLRSYKQLSDGQKYRYRIAKLLESGKQWWLMDEFAATLDRDTAKIVAYNLQKFARQQGRAVIAATTHNDLQEDLAPNVLVQKRFGKEISISYYPDAKTSQCSLIKEMTIEPGTIQDWHNLSQFHYRGHRTSSCRKIFRLMRGTELCGVIVYTYPPAACYGRRMMLPQMNMLELNQNLSTINRVVVHPKYRTIGLGAKIIRETLLYAPTRYVEMIAVMAKYSPFAEKAGMIRVCIQQPWLGIIKISKVLIELGFDLQLVGSHRYVQEKLQSLTPEQVGQIKIAVMKAPHPRYKKEVEPLRHDPWGKKAIFDVEVQKANLELLAKFVRLTGMLLQEKVYLFWKKEA